MPEAVRRIPGKTLGFSTAWRIVSAGGGNIPRFQWENTRRGPRRAHAERLDLGARAGPFELELLDPIANLIAVQPQKARGFRLVPAGSLERLHEERTLQLLEVDAAGRQLDSIAQADRTGGRWRKVGDAEQYRSR